MARNCPEVEKEENEHELCWNGDEMSQTVAPAVSITGEAVKDNGKTAGQKFVQTT